MTTEINPGISRTVEWLQKRGFQTVDSGDGKTHDFDCDLPYPYVHIRVSKQRLIVTADRLKRLVEKRGVYIGEPIIASMVVGATEEDERKPFISAEYNPARVWQYVTLGNVDDALLFGEVTP